MENKNVEIEFVMNEMNVVMYKTMGTLDLLDITNAINNEMINEENGFSVLGKGTYGTVFGYKDYAIKIFYDEDDDKNNDVEVLKNLDYLDCIPNLYALIDYKFLVMQRVKGNTVRQFCVEGAKNEKIFIDETFIEKWENALLDIVKAGYSPDDLHESNVMIDEDTLMPMMVDVGWFFKHNEDYNNFDIHMMKTDYGYSRAQTWTGDSLKIYVKRQRVRMEKESKRLLEKYKKGVEIAKAGYKTTLDTVPAFNGGHIDGKLYIKSLDKRVIV